MPKYEIAKTFTFCASHRLPYLPEEHKCRSGHGHNYTATVALTADTLDERGFVVDYAELSPVKQWLEDRSNGDNWDHHDLNDNCGFDNPTAEIIAERLCALLPTIVPALNGERVHIAYVKVTETDNTYAICRPVLSAAPPSAPPSPTPPKPAGAPPTAPPTTPPTVAPTSEPSPAAPPHPAPPKPAGTPPTAPPPTTPPTVAPTSEPKPAASPPKKDTTAAKLTEFYELVKQMGHGKQAANEGFAKRKGYTLDQATEQEIDELIGKAKAVVEQRRTAAEDSSTPTEAP